MKPIEDKHKVQPRLIDIKYLDRELVKLFASVRWGRGDDLFLKYKSRFVNEQKLRRSPDSIPTKNSMLSVGKKLEILCTYGNHRIVKMDRKAHS